MYRKRWILIDAEPNDKGVIDYFLVRVCEARNEKGSVLRRMRSYKAHLCAGKYIVYDDAVCNLDSFENVEALGYELEKGAVYYGRTFKDKKRLSIGGKVKRR